MKKYFAECIGTATLVILGCGTAMLVGCDAAAGSGYLLTALAFGLTSLPWRIPSGTFPDATLTPPYPWACCSPAA